MPRLVVSPLVPPDEHPPPPPPCRWPALITLPTLAKFQLVCLMLCCSTPPACPSTPSRPSVHYPSISLVVNVMYIQTFCENINVLFIFDQADMYRFEVRLELYVATASIVIPPSLSPSPPPTPPPSRWPALTTLTPLAEFQLIWHLLCEALLFSSSLARQKHPSLLSRLV